MSYTITITEKGGKPRTDTFELPEITIGRVQDNDIVLPKGNVSKKHSRIVLREGKFVIVDLKSTNGTFVNGKRISAPQVLKDSDKIHIGDFTLIIDSSSLRADEPQKPDIVTAPVPPKEPPPREPPVREPPVREPPVREPPRAETRPAPQPQVPLDPPLSSSGVFPEEGSGNVDAPRPSPQSPPRPRPPTRETGAMPPRAPSRAEPRPAGLDPAVSPRIAADLPPPQVLQGRASVFASAAKAVLPPDQSLPADDEYNREKTRAAVEKALQQRRITGARDLDQWGAQIAREICSYGPLTELLDDASVVEVFVNGPHEILVRRLDESGALLPLTPVSMLFSSDEAAVLVVRRMLAASGQPFDAAHPVAEGRLADGTRVNAVHPVASVRGIALTITRNAVAPATWGDLVAAGALSRAMADFLDLCVRSRRNVCIASAAGADDGALYGPLTANIGDDERIVVVEPVARLKLPQPHVVALEPRPQQGRPASVTMRELVANALRMRPDRLIVDDVAGGEALELLLAMAGRQQGTLFSMRAQSASNALDRLATLLQLGGLVAPSHAIREQIVSAVDVVVVFTRFADGTARVTQISEVTGIEVDLITTQDIFSWKRDRGDERGTSGRFTPSGAAPRFIEDLQRRGESVNLAMFRAD